MDTNTRENIRETVHRTFHYVLVHVSYFPKIYHVKWVKTFVELDMNTDHSNVFEILLKLFVRTGKWVTFANDRVINASKYITFTGITRNEKPDHFFFEPEPFLSIYKQQAIPSI